MSTNKLKFVVPALHGVHGSRAIHCLFLNRVKKRRTTQTVPLEQFVVRVPIERLFLVVLPWQRQMARADLEMLAGERAQHAQRIAQIQSMEATAAELNATTAQLTDVWAVERAARWEALEAEMEATQG